jgi:hypothetical protein
LTSSCRRMRLSCLILDLLLTTILLGATRERWSSNGWQLACRNTLFMSQVQEEAKGLLIEDDFPQPGGCTKTTMPPSQQQKLLAVERQEAQGAILIRPTGEVDLTSVLIFWSNVKALLEVWSACRRRPECNSAHGLHRIRGVAGLFSWCACISHQGWPSTPSSTTPSAGRRTLNPIRRVRTELR